MFAIARVTPGPGSMITTLIGWKVAGLAGALVATLALFVPACIGCFVAARAWNKYRGTEWHTAIETGLRPVAAGIVGGSRRRAAAARGNRAAVLDRGRRREPGLRAGCRSCIPAPMLVGGGVAYVAAYFAGLTAL